MVEDVLMDVGRHPAEQPADFLERLGPVEAVVLRERGGQAVDAGRSNPHPISHPHTLGGSL